MTGLDGRVALVTGGSRGIGAAIATRLAADGADVAITYARAEDRAAEVVGQIEGLGRKALAIRADSADAEALTSAVDSAAGVLGGLDVLVNNAGIFAVTPVEELAVADIDRMLAIHVRAVLVATKAAVPHMTRGGRIISVGSNLAERAIGPGLSLYSASKSALLGLTRALGRELAPRGITAVVVQPGSTDTEMNPAGGEHAAAQLALNPSGRFAEPADIAATVAHLAGDGGRLITGTAITIDGGLNA
ncbi:NAD(P)-dependent dehydrogenase, short-chain alcohol dehydrogenase family [Amycolatopsis arida]|uniref:NAD(P)-dependent dehydrogenase, short-chain alcohol dehydrogenase family n=1 Tax=Amycolatopsis arida TaxID=587909 RepID=A0A1I5WZN1_9PSEU|nr:SDR family NAD(P)-dependent oxidoreductase [Amycolatopsis arida]TDX92527.1 NAD(P)-dependent dehydrogenase (short-subunit alcohol dehydrogenase family) [Amycolatopsis arida]SFQ25114.1 NAD(P)-dependent dehydrogenase, short-chain alcohol dehydrogenase family [Amycolatopsis arida]